MKKDPVNMIQTSEYGRAQRLSRELQELKESSEMERSELQHEIEELNISLANAKADVSRMMIEVDNMCKIEMENAQLREHVDSLEVELEDLQLTEEELEKALALNENL